MKAQLDLFGVQFDIKILSRVGVCVRDLLDRFWIGWLYLLKHHSGLHVITDLHLISAIYSSPLQTLASSVYYSLHYPFPGNGF
jgi:hypothetical protein